MTNILITDPGDQGPGDILGAIGGEADIDPAIIGNFDINGSKAFVEVHDEKAIEVVR